MQLKRISERRVHSTYLLSLLLSPAHSITFIVCRLASIKSPRAEWLSLILSSATLSDYFQVVVHLMGRNPRERLCPYRSCMQPSRYRKTSDEWSFFARYTNAVWLLQILSVHSLAYARSFQHFGMSADHGGFITFTIVDFVELFQDSFDQVIHQVSYVL